MKALLLTVVLIFDSEPAPQFLRSLTKETVWAEEKLGRPMQWMRVDEIRGKDLPGDVVLLRIHGKCRDQVKPSRALGWTDIVDGSFLSSIHVDCDRVATLLTQRLATRDDVQLARAVARVATHELMHVQRQSARHDPSGWFRESVQASELVTDDLRITAHSIAIH